jgi:hypothetical protein
MTTEDWGLTVSLRAEVPAPLLVAMRQFIERHPHWDQYRLVQAALAGFLVQNGSKDRGVTRCYLANLFPNQGDFHRNDMPAPAGQQPPLALPHPELHDHRDSQGDRLVA